MNMLALLLLALLAVPGGQAQGRPPFPSVERPPIPCDATGQLVADYRLSKESPGVYISFERTGPAADPLAVHLLEAGDDRASRRRGRDYWLRLHNNSVWAVSVKSYGTHTGSSPEMITLLNGKTVFATADGMEVAVAYSLRNADGRTIPVNPGIDMFWRSWLPPGRSVLFSVPRKALGKDRVVVVDYSYEWEEGQVFNYNVAPTHRVEFWAHSLPR